MTKNEMWADMIAANEEYIAKAELRMEKLRDDLRDDLPPELRSMTMNLLEGEMATVESFRKHIAFMRKNITYS